MAAAAEVAAVETETAVDGVETAREAGASGAVDSEAGATVDAKEEEAEDAAPGCLLKLWLENWNTWTDKTKNKNKHTLSEREL